MSCPVPPPHIQALKPYQAGRSIEEIREEYGFEKIYKLASNENPLGASPRALERIRDVTSGLATYPNAGLTLRKELAKRLHVKLENVVAGSGSESIMLNAMRGYLLPGDEVITAEGTFIGYYVIANAMNLDMKLIPLKNYTFDLDAIADAITPRTKMIYLPNPNNPTGTAFTRDEYLRFLDRLPEGPMVVMDEAYFEFAMGYDEYPDSLKYPHDQVLTLRTFSKAYGLAGARIGYGVGPADIIGTILKVKLPFEPTSMAQAAGLGALEDDEFLQKTVQNNADGMKRITAAMDDLGLEYTNSLANFVLVILDSPERAVWMSDQLLQNGIIARPMTPFLVPHAVRITIGNEEETTELIQTLRKIFG